MLSIGNKMGYFKMLASALLLAFAVLQGTEGYSQKAEEALKNLTDYELLVSKDVTSGGGGSLKIAANAVSSVADFWTDKVIQAANQADQVKRFTLPEFLSRITSLEAVLARIDTQSTSKLRDAKTLFNTAAMPIKTAIEIVYLLKNVPMETITYDKVKELLESAMAVVSQVKPSLTGNTTRILAEVKAAVSKASSDLDNFTTKNLRDQCYPNVVCVANKLDDLKRSVQNAASTLESGSNTIIQISMQVDLQTNIKMREEEEKIRAEAKKWAELYLSSHSITKDAIRDYFLQIVVKYNPTSKQVQDFVNNALSKVSELTYYFTLGQNLTRNQIYGAVYPVVDAYNTVYYLNRNYEGKVLGNEVTVTYQLISELYNETVKIMPDFTNEINAFYEEVRKINLSVSVSTTKYVEKTVDESQASDLLEFYALYSGLVYEEIPQPIEEANQKINALLAQVASLTPKLMIAFENLRIAVELKIQKLFEDYMYGVANRFYTGGKLQMKDLYYYGSFNINNTFKYWTPIISAEDSAVEVVYKAIVQRNYATLNIYNELVEIAATVLQVLKQYTYLFGEDLIKKRSANVVSRLVDIPSKDYLELIAYNLQNITDLYNSKQNYVNRVPVLEADRIAFLKLGVQTFSNSKVPFVDYNHYLNNKIYKSKLSLSDIVKALLNIKNGMLASEAGINAAAGDILERIRLIANEYITILHKYAQLKIEGKPFLSDLPTITIIAIRILRERYGLEVHEIPDFTEDIVRSDEYYASLNF